MQPLFKCLSLVLVALCLMAGCASFQDGDPFATYITARALDEFVKRDNDPVDRATKMLTSAERIEARVGPDTTTTLAKLKAEFIKELPPRHDPGWFPGEYDAWLQLIDNIVADIEAEAVDAAGDFDIDRALMSTHRFLNIVIMVARRYVPDVD